ncbi:MAG: hypothetical protein ABIR31_07430, partial [Ginsengibacter sp.]
VTITLFGEVYVNGLGTFGATVSSAVTVPLSTVSIFASSDAELSEELVLQENINIPATATNAVNRNLFFK